MQGHKELVVWQKAAENKSVINQAGEVGRMLAGLRRSLQSRLESPES
jgi:hypothetical protein